MFLVNVVEVISYCREVVALKIYLNLRQKNYHKKIIIKYLVNKYQVRNY